MVGCPSPPSSFYQKKSAPVGAGWGDPERETTATGAMARLGRTAMLLLLLAVLLATASSPAAAAAGAGEEEKRGEIDQLSSRFDYRESGVPAGAASMVARDGRGRRKS